MLRVFEPNMGWRETLAVARQVWSRRVSPGDKVAEFEAMLCAATGAKHAVCCNSGTTALMLAIKGVLIREDMDYDHVIVPSYTFSAAANVASALLRMGVRQTAIVDGVVANGTPRQAGILVFVSHNGMWADQANIIAWGNTSESGGDTVHDAAQSLGMFRMDSGGFTDPTTTLSFSGPKIVTTGAGGAVLSNNRRVADSVRGVCDHGGGNWRKTRIHESPGGNFRMSDVNAAIGVAQMKRLPELLGIRRERFAWYRRHFPEMPTDGWCCLVRTTKAQECIAAMKAAGYEALQPYRPLQESVPYRHLPVDPEAVKAADELLYLGNHWRVRRRDVDTISGIIKRIDPCATGN